MNHESAKEYWVTMTHGEKLVFVVANGNAASFAYQRLHIHRDAAHKQMDRIVTAIQNSNSKLTEPDGGASQVEMREYIREGVERLRPVLYEVHFYFVSWGNCRNMLEILVGQPEFLEAKKVYDSHRKEFEYYVAGRNSFEHYHDRLPGQKNENRVREVRPDPNAGAHRIFTGFHEGKYVHSDMSWDISPDSLTSLDSKIEDVLKVVHRITDELFAKKGMSA